MCLTVFATLTLGQRPGLAAETRFALVIGNDQYQSGRLATSVNDAGLIANALQSAGFTVTGASNLDQATLRESFREFLDQVAAAGPDAVALVYLAGYGLQFEGENYFVPVDANIQHETDVPLQAIRISDFTQALAALPGHVKLVILDVARQNPFPHGSEPLASGLALVDPAPTMAIAFNAAPGTVAPDEPGPYGAYATSITEMIADGGLTLDDLFARVRLRVSDVTKGTEIPWYASQITSPFFMTERIAGAPPPANVMPLADIRNRPLREFGGPDDAYAAALELDTVEGYEQFLAIYPDGPYSRRVAAMLAIRREEIVWRRCVIADTPPAYWSYLRRYPNGPHVWDARRRLAMLSATYDPPPSFVAIDFGFPPPPPYELAFIDRPIVVFEGPGFAPPPPPPLFFLPPRPHEFAALPPPPPPPGRFILPVVAAAAVTAFIRPPQNVAPRPMPLAMPGGRPAMTVALPAAVQAAARAGGAGVPPAPGLPGLHGPAAVNPAIPQNNQAAPPSPATAAVKPSPLPHVSPMTPAMVQPTPPPPPPASSTAPKRAFIQPSPPPPSATTPKPAFVKPPSPPPPPAATAPKPAFIKPPPPPSGTPPHPPGPVAAKPLPPGKPACPPGKTLTPQGCK